MSNELTVISAERCSVCGSWKVGGSCPWPSHNVSTPADRPPPTQQAFINALPYTPRNDMNDNKDKHIRVKTKHCSRQKLEFFHYAISHFDPDWPWAPELLRREGNHSYGKTCKECGGNLWINAMIEPSEVLKLAVQVAEMKDLPGQFPLSISMYSSSCKGEVK